MITQTRRQFLATTTALGASLALPQIAGAADPIIIGVPGAKSGLGDL